MIPRTYEIPVTKMLTKAEILKESYKFTMNDVTKTVWRHNTSRELTNFFQLNLLIIELLKYNIAVCLF